MFPLYLMTAYALRPKLNDNTDNIQWLDSYSLEDIACAQKADVHVREVHTWIRDNLQPSSEELKSHANEVCVLMSRHKSLLVRNDVLYRQCTAKNGRQFLQVVLPLALRHDVLHSLHDLKVVGHLGVQRTIRTSPTTLLLAWPCARCSSLVCSMCKVCW